MLDRKALAKQMCNRCLNELFIQKGGIDSDVLIL